MFEPSDVINFIQMILGILILYAFSFFTYAHNFSSGGY